MYTNIQLYGPHRAVSMFYHRRIAVSLIMKCEKLKEFPPEVEVR